MFNREHEIQRRRNRGSTVTPEQLIAQNSREIEDLLRENERKVTLTAMLCIESVLSSAGLKYSWESSSERFEDFVNDVDASESVKAELLRLNNIYDEVSETFALQYECIRECRPAKSGDF